MACWCMTAGASTSDCMISSTIISFSIPSRPFFKSRQLKSHQPIKISLSPTLRACLRNAEEREWQVKAEDRVDWVDWVEGEPSLRLAAPSTRPRSSFKFKIGSLGHLITPGHSTHANIQASRSAETSYRTCTTTIGIKESPAILYNAFFILIASIHMVVQF